MNYLINVPFEDAPRELIEQLNSCNFTYEEYLSMCSMYNNLDVYWNMAIFKNGEMVVFLWGTIEPLEKFAHVIRISIKRTMQGEVIRKYLFDCMTNFSKDIGIPLIFFITDKPEIFIGNGPGRIKMSDSRVVEVIIK